MARAADKIDEILTLAGVAPRDFVRARKNYEQLDESELDRRLERLRIGAARVSSWRKQRQSQKLQPIAIASHDLSQFDSSLQRVDDLSRSLEQIASSFEKNFGDRSVLPTIHHAVMWVRARLRNLSDSSQREHDITRELINQVAGLNQFASSYALKELGALLQHPVIPVETAGLTTAGMVEALARIENAVEGSPPDLFVAVNEGRIIADAIRLHLNLSSAVVRVRGTLDTNIQWTDEGKITHPHTVWVIGHVAKTASTLVEVMNQCRRRYPEAKVLGGVLAASVRAAPHLSKFSYHQLAEAPVVRLPVDIVREPERLLQLPSNLVEQTRRDIARMFPDGMSK